MGSDVSLNNDSDKSIEALNDERSKDIAKKVLEDINFLKDRISRIKRTNNINPGVLNTYESMLESRQSVLKWLEENGDIDLGEPQQNHAS